MTTFRKYLLASVLTLHLFAANTSHADADSSAQLMSFEQAAAILQGRQEAEDRIVGMLMKHRLGRTLANEAGPEFEAKWDENFDRKATAIRAPFSQFDRHQLAQAFFAADDAIALTRALDDLSVHVLQTHLKTASEQGFVLPQHNIPSIVALLRDPRDPLDTMSDIRRAWWLQNGALYYGTFETVAATIWSDVLRLLPIDVRSDVVVAALDGDFPLVSSAIAGSLDSVGFTDLALRVDTDWLLTRVSADRRKWLPLLIHVAGDEQIHLVAEQLIQIPEDQQIGVYARKPRLGRQADLERLGVWLLGQDSIDVDANLVYQLASVARDMDSRASFQWLEDQLFDLPHSQEVSARFFRELSSQTWVRKNGPSQAFKLRLHQSNNSLGHDIKRIVALHEHDASATRALAVSVLLQAERFAPHDAGRCAEWLAHGYLLATDSAHVAPPIAINGRDNVLASCGQDLIELADSMKAIPTLDWLLNTLSEPGAAESARTEGPLVRMKHDDLRNHAADRLQGTAYWQSLRESTRERLARFRQAELLL